MMYLKHTGNIEEKKNENLYVFRAKRQRSRLIYVYSKSADVNKEE